MFADEQTRHQAFTLIVDKYSQRLYWIIRKVVISHHDADDLTQNVMIKAWSSLTSFRSESSLYTWLYRIAVNESLSFLRSKRTRFFVPFGDNTSQLERIAEAENLFDGDSIQKALQKALIRLPAKQRTVFNMRYYDQMPYEQMSAVLDTSVGSLKASYHHAAKKIEEWVQQEIVDVE